jgi:hypothetical protein
MSIKKGITLIFLVVSLMTIDPLFAEEFAQIGEHLSKQAGS